MSNRNLYSILGVSQSAEISEIRTAYKQLAKEHHPDKGGDPEKFKELSQAHEILSDPGKRKHYDMTGSITDQSGGMSSPFGQAGFPDMFSHMFGGMFPGNINVTMNGRKKEGKGPGKTQDIPLSISDYYHGRNLSIKLGRQSSCKGCKGSGALSTKPCDQCGGNGQVRQMVMMGPIQMMSQTPCHPCNGSGQQNVGKCNDCQGRGAIHEEKTLEMKVEPGMMSGNTVTFSGMCSAHPNYTEAGDVIVIFREAEEEGNASLWIREGTKLKSSVTISLTDALVGTSKILQGHPGYPNGLVINIPSGVQNGWNGCIPQLGMPIRGTPKFGDAHISVTIMPSPEEIAALKENIQTIKSFMPTMKSLDGTHVSYTGKWAPT